MREPESQHRWPNEAAALDAAIPFCLHIGRQSRGASEPQC
jgi:hypothetical protein